MGKLRVEQTGINESSGGVYAHPFRAPEAAPDGSRRGACRGEANSCRGGRPRVAGWVVTKPCQLWCGRPVLRRPRRRGPGLRAHHGQRPVPSSNTCASVFQPATASATSERQPGRARYLRQRTRGKLCLDVIGVVHAPRPPSGPGVRPRACAGRTASTCSTARESCAVADLASVPRVGVAVSGCRRRSKSGRFRRLKSERGV